MDIASLATRLNQIDLDLEEFDLDMFASKEDKKKKEQEKREVLNALLFYNEFEELYENNEKFELDNKLLYPFKEIIDENGKKSFIRKDSEEYKEDVNAYIEELTNALNEGKIDKKTFDEMKEEAIELANKQMDKIEEEEKQQEEEIDLTMEHQKILDSIVETKQAFIIHEIGENSYSSLAYKYKNMQEIERKELLHKAHVGLCKEMGIKCDLDFTKYDIDEDRTVDRDGYCIKTKDINNIPFPFDTILLEQSFKLYIHNIINSKEYTPRQKEELIELLYKDLSLQKDLILDLIKKRELTPYGC